MSRKGRLLVAGGILVVVLVAIGGTATYLLRSHQAPAALALSSPAPIGSPSALAGTWTVTSGSEVGYRVREQFINQPGPTEAVARTTKVAGSLQVQGPDSALKATGHVTADLSALVSQDKYANYQVYQRDFFIRKIYLETDRYPNAEFTAASVAIPPGIESSPVSVTVAGTLKVHGVTKAVTAQLQAQRTVTGIEIAGSINVDMRDFNVEVPSISFTRAEPGVVIEYHLLLVRA